MIHGGGGGVWSWDEVVKYLNDFRILMPELPEHGSSQNTGPFTIGSAAESIVQMIGAHVPGGKAHVFGLSVGGQIVVEMLARAPEAMLSAIVSGAQLLPIPGYNLGIYSEQAMATIYWLFIHPWKSWDAWIRFNMRTSAGIPDTYFRQFKQNFQNLTRNSWAHVMSDNYRYRTPMGLGNANLPVLLIAGPREKIDIQPSNRLLGRVLPNCRQVLLSNTRGWSTPKEHNWVFSAPELCAQVIRAWAGNQPLPAGLKDV